MGRRAPGQGGWRGFAVFQTSGMPLDQVFFWGKKTSVSGTRRNFPARRYNVKPAAHHRDGGRL